MLPENSDETDDTFLGGALAILQPKAAFRAGIDAVLLAAAVPDLAGRASTILDAGAGVGVAGLCVARRSIAARVTLLEKAPELASLARRNVSRNGLEDRVIVIEADLLAPAAQLGAAGAREDAFDVVLTNPPWLEVGRARPSADPIKARANAMPEGDLDGWLRFLARVTSPGGTLVLLHRADALDRVLAAVHGRFGGVDILPIHPRQGQPANRVILRATKGSRAPLALLAGFIVHEETGFTAPMEAILRTGAPLPWTALR